MIGKIILRVMLIIAAVGLGIGAAYAVNQRMQSAVTVNGTARNPQGMSPYGNGGRMRSGPWNQNPNLRPGVRSHLCFQLSGPGMNRNQFGPERMGPGRQQNWGNPESRSFGRGCRMTGPRATGPMPRGWWGGQAAPGK